MFTLWPWRWTHWFLLLVGALFLGTYLNLLSWGPVVEVIPGLAGQPGASDGFKGFSLRAEALLGLISLLLLTPLVGMVALFLLLLVWTGLAGTLGPIAHRLGIPDWAFILLLATASAGVVYAKSGAWLPWAETLIERITSAYLIPLL